MQQLIKWHCCLLGFSIATMAPSQPAPVTASASAQSAAPREVSRADYSGHLTALVAVVDACARARDKESCDPALVGADERVTLANEHRTVRYGWLRSLLERAQAKDSPVQREEGTRASASSFSARRSTPTTTELLQEAHARLAADLAQAEQALQHAGTHAQAHAALQQVLAGDAYRGLKDTTRRNALLEWLNQWLNSLFTQAGALRLHSPWLGRALVWGFILAICVALAWRMLQLERRWRMQLVPGESMPARSAASARGWQHWLDDARQAAGKAQWREALHFMYWAAIARLESRRLWPADRARTPREYLALMDDADPRKARLATLSGAFERTWYGGRPAAEDDYRRAEQIARALIEGEAR
jgi:hypothetical protein